MLQERLRPLNYMPTLAELEEASSRDFYKLCAIDFKDPNQAFSPTSAISSNPSPFISSSSPDAQKIKKKIIVSYYNFHIFLNSSIAKFKKLQDQGFEIYFALNDNKLYKPNFIDSENQFLINDENGNSVAGSLKDNIIVFINNPSFESKKFKISFFATIINFKFKIFLS